MVTELVSVDGIIQSYLAGDKLSKTFELMEFGEDERPIFVQIFGGDPVKVEEAVKIVVAEMHPDGIDINMGCPAHKIVCNGYGCALLKDPALAATIVRAAKRATNLTVTVKTRIGWSDDSLIDEFAHAIADAGADALALHGRTYEQGFTGEANWEPIYRLKKTLKIPLYGNGDIRTGNDALEKVKDLDGILIGRAAVGNPWIFAEVQAALGHGEFKDVAHEVSWPVKYGMLRFHAQLKLAQKGERGLVEMRKFIPAYIKGLPQAGFLRASTNSIASMDDVEVLINHISEIVGA